ncbi:hypothetical protein [Demequina sediminicola]|uniref:hypothetical protein n=1 Tax=Demequina sediminicola TaxID=1095026 RepID=UPI00078104FE|nr:hypothetical protein [Demequina sediminicola]
MTEQSPQPRPSILDSVRSTAMGPFATALGVAVLVGLLLSFLVPADTGSLALIVLGALVASGVGVTVRYLTSARGWKTQLSAFVPAVIGVHLMGVVGTLTGTVLPLARFTGVEMVSFDTALQTALATPPVSAGTLLAGLVAAIIAGWAKPSAPAGESGHTSA